VDFDDAHIGRRAREIRNWRGMTLAVTAGLAGITKSYLSMIERGDRTVTKPALLEGLARALRVSPAELTGGPFAPVDSADNEAHAGIVGLETALDTYDLGVDPIGITPRPWPELANAVRELYEVWWAAADFAAQGRILPGVLAELHATYVRDPDHRREALVGLIQAYRSAAGVCKFLGVRGLPLLAARLVQRCADELGTAEWIGFASFVRGFAGLGEHRYDLSIRAAAQLQNKHPNELQVAGALQLNAALAAAAAGNGQLARDHLVEAEDLTKSLPEKRSNFGYLHIGPEHVGEWRVSLETELGQGPKVAEFARSVDSEAIPGKARRAAFLADVGRSLAVEKATREQGIQTLVRAEEIAPQLIRNNVFVRETVGDLLRRVRRDATGRDLRGLAWRMGIAPVG
jgi:transcriptional regulator with XRE-family HTH domain